jgi:proteasome lid subunit RPN8/RPN11
MNFTSNGIFIKPDHWAQMEADVESKAPEEACGIVIGNYGHSRFIIPVTNILHSQSRFRMEPQEQLEAFLLADEKRMEILAIYHSHPQGIDKPSITDHEELTFPGIIYLIWFIDSNKWRCRGYLMNPIESIEVPVTIAEEK